MEVVADFLVSGYKLTGSIENDSGNHAITGVSMRLVNENGGRFLYLHDYLQICLNVITRIRRSVLWKLIPRVLSPSLTFKMVFTEWLIFITVVITRHLC